MGHQTHLLIVHRVALSRSDPLWIVPWQWRAKRSASPHLNMWVAPQGQQHVSPRQCETPPWVSAIKSTQPWKGTTT